MSIGILYHISHCKSIWCSMFHVKNKIKIHSKVLTFTHHDSMLDDQFFLIKYSFINCVHHQCNYMVT
jgi:hypothetical protein